MRDEKRISFDHLRRHSHSRHIVSGWEDRPRECLLFYAEENLYEIGERIIRRGRGQVDEYSKQNYHRQDLPRELFGTNNELPTASYDHLCLLFYCHATYE